MTKQFTQTVDKRSRQEMIDFLSEHLRYATMSTWNGLNSFAHCVKLHSLNLPTEITDTAYAMLGLDQICEPWVVIDEILIPEWTAQMDGRFTVGRNGRSGGYFVLYKSHYEQDPHKSICTSCGQKNFKRVPPEFPDTPEGRVKEYVTSHTFWTENCLAHTEPVTKHGLPEEKVRNIIKSIKADIKENGEFNTGRCGKCGQPLRSFSQQLLKVSSEGIEEDWEDMDMDDLRYWTNVVQKFDQLVQDLVDYFIDYCRNHHVEEETIMVQKKIKVPVENA